MKNYNQRLLMHVDFMIWSWRPFCS